MIYQNFTYRLYGVSTYGDYYEFVLHEHNTNNVLVTTTNKISISDELWRSWPEYETDNKDIYFLICSMFHDI